MIRSEFYMVCNGCSLYLGEHPDEGGEDYLTDNVADLIDTARRRFGWHTNDLDTDENLCPQCWRSRALDRMHAGAGDEDQAVPADDAPPHGIERPRAEMLAEIERAEAAGHYSHAAKLIERMDP